MTEITHRCEGSLKNEISIRFTKQFDSLETSDDFVTWRLFKPEIDYDYSSMYLSHVGEIKFCPFCGKELKDIREEYPDLVDQYENTRFKPVITDAAKPKKCSPYELKKINI